MLEVEVVLEIVAEEVAWLGMARSGVAHLNHESIHYTVHQKAVVETFVHQLYKIVAMERCLVEQLHTEVSCRGFKQHLHIFFALGLCTDAQEGQADGKQKFFHIQGDSFHRYQARVSELIFHHLNT